MVNALNSELSGSGSSPGQGHCIVFLGKTLALTVPIFTQVFKWVPANLMLRVTLQWTNIPMIQGGVEMVLPDRPLVSKQTLL